MEQLSRDSKIAIAATAITLVGGLLMTAFHLSLFWAVIYVIIIIIGAIIALLLPRISNKIGVRSPFFQRTSIARMVQALPTIQQL